MKQNTFFPTFTFNDDVSLIWSFASIPNPGEGFSTLKRDSDWNFTPISLVTLPLAVTALLHETTLPEVLESLYKSQWPSYMIPEPLQPFRDDVLFAEGILTRPLIPVSFRRSYGSAETPRAASNLELYSLSDLVPEVKYPPNSHPTGLIEIEPERASSPLFWASREGNSFLVLDHPKALVLGGRFDAHQLFDIWKTFIEWLYG
jgi:hypothetical protein